MKAQAMIEVEKVVVRDGNGKLITDITAVQFIGGDIIICTKNALYTNSERLKKSLGSNPLNEKE